MQVRLVSRQCKQEIQSTAKLSLNKNRRTTLQSAKSNWKNDDRNFSARAATPNHRIQLPHGSDQWKSVGCSSLIQQAEGKSEREKEVMETRNDKWKTNWSFFNEQTSELYQQRRRGGLGFGWMCVWWNSQTEQRIDQSALKQAHWHNVLRQGAVSRGTTPPARHTNQGDLFGVNKRNKRERRSRACVFIYTCLMPSASIPMEPLNARTTVTCLGAILSITQRRRVNPLLCKWAQPGRGVAWQYCLKKWAGNEKVTRFAILFNFYIQPHTLS